MIVALPKRLHPAAPPAEIARSGGAGQPIKLQAMLRKRTADSGSVIRVLRGYETPAASQPRAVEAILKDISCAQNLQHDLSVFGTAGDRASQLGVLGQYLSLVDDFPRHNRSKRGVLPVEKFYKAVDIGESRVRPFELHRSRQARNAGVPHV